LVNNIKKYKKKLYDERVQNSKCKN